LFDEAARLGIEALAITDRNSLAGIVRAHEAARTTGVRLIVGCRLDLTDGMSLLPYPIDARLRAALPIAFTRQEARRQGAMPARLV
jgi:error-prone DNA polymerase